MSYTTERVPKVREQKLLHSKSDRWTADENKRHIFRPGDSFRERKRRKYCDVPKKEDVDFFGWSVRRKKALVRDEPISIEERFFQLAKKWKIETAMSSLVIEKITNTNYVAIIGLGIIYKDQILKLILQDLKKREEFWHYALKKIADDNPVPKGMVNNLSKVREAWLTWATDHQLI